MRIKSNHSQNAISNALEISHQIYKLVCENRVVWNKLMSYIYSHYVAEVTALTLGCTNCKYVIRIKLPTPKFEARVI